LRILNLEKIDKILHLEQAEKAPTDAGYHNRIEYDVLGIY
jgi:hypothetical protein